MEKATEIFDLLFAKIWNVAAWIFLGLIGKFSMDVMTGKKITVLQALASTGTALFVGVMAHVICAYLDLGSQSAFIVPLATLLSDKIVIALMAMNVNKLVNKIGYDLASWWQDFFKTKK